MNLIKNLAISYIEKPSCIILLTVACESMFYFVIRLPFNRGMQPISSTRVRIGSPRNTTLAATEPSVCCWGHFPLGTINNGLFIGVLTKPDRIPKTEEESWLPLIRGERGDTTLWFCVKCPSTQQINSGITWEEAREREAAFFSRTSPWSILDNAFKQRLGTGQLTRCLSDKLCDLIAERFVCLAMRRNKSLPNSPQPPQY